MEFSITGFLFLHIIGIIYRITYEGGNVMMFDDTIAAISTAIGEGGIGIIRISGEEALGILNKVFKSISNRDNNGYGKFYN